MPLPKMPSPKQRQLRTLPKSFPVGTVYVVEGRSGQSGRLRVSSRYLIIPGGGRIDFVGRPAPRQSDRVQDRGKDRAHRRGLRRGVAANQPRPAGTRIKARAAAAKKFLVVPGTGA
jgi:hypothetical protein